jgi:hypothetical protein
MDATEAGEKVSSQALTLMVQSTGVRDSLFTFLPMDSPQTMVAIQAATMPWWHLERGVAFRFLWHALLNILLTVRWNYRDENGSAPIRQRAFPPPER